MRFAPAGIRPHWTPEIQRQTCHNKEERLHSDVLQQRDTLIPPEWIAATGATKLLPQPARLGCYDFLGRPIRDDDPVPECHYQPLIPASSMTIPSLISMSSLRNIVELVLSKHTHTPVRANDVC